MRILKLFVVFIFVLAVFFCFGKRFFESTVSAQTSLSAPTGVNASDGSYSTKIGLYWDTIRGAALYRIFRSTTNNPVSAIEIGTTQTNFFFDTTTPQNQTFFYWIRAENGNLQSSLSQAEQGIRALGNVNQNNPPIEPPPIPPANQMTAAKAYLGKTLFWDEQLSSTRTVSCGTCHTAGQGGSDPRSSASNSRSVNPGFDLVFNTADDVIASPGVSQSSADGNYFWSNSYGLREQVTGRKANSFVNAAYAPNLFWDGRAAPTFRDPLTNAIIINNGGALESQAVGPIVNSTEMAHTGRSWGDVVTRLSQSKPLALAPNLPTALKTWIDGRNYADLFQEVFGTNEISAARIALAIATYERTLFSDQSPWDADAGGITPLTAQENRGRGVFNQAQCNVCHAGNQLTDNTFRNIGIRPQNEDTGRFQVTGNNQDLGEFRVPSLRNVELRAPYMHNGRFATLEDVIEFYNRGGDFPNTPNFPANLIRPRNLSPAQKTDLAAFLRRPLTDNRVRNEAAPFDRPTLYTESNHVPQITGTGIAGSNSIVPNVIAAEPPIVGNPSFTVALQNALGGANSVLVVSSTDPGATSTIPANGSFARVAAVTNGSGANNGYASVSLQIPDNAALVGQTFFGRWYVQDAGAPGGVAVSQAFRFTVFGEATAAVSAKFADFDGDGKTDISVFRPAEGNWYILNSLNNTAAASRFGLSGDKLVPADYDGDGKADIAVYRGGIWYLNRSRDGFTAVSFGLADDKPQAGDFDGDGKADVAVFRPSNGTWYVQQSRDGFIAVQFGLSFDRPVAADYDGDGKTDFAVYRDGVWYVQRSRDGFTADEFGIAEDKPVIGDYDQDGKNDLAVFRPSTGVWYVLKSSDGGSSAVQFGIGSDIPSPGDYDGDGRADNAVFRPSEGNWYIRANSNGITRVQSFGLGSDISVPGSIVP